MARIGEDKDRESTGMVGRAAGRIAGGIAGSVANDQFSKMQNGVRRAAYKATENTDGKFKPAGDGSDTAGASGGAGGGGYTQDPNAAQANALYQQLISRGPFQYDLQGDMLYRQYADQYSQLGRQAMMDTMGSAAGLTGGYGNSYANTVGNQAYQQYLGQLNAMIPDFYDRAYQRWQDQGNDLYNQYQLALSRVSGRGGGGSGDAEDTEDTTGDGENTTALPFSLDTLSPFAQYVQEANLGPILAAWRPVAPTFDYYDKYREMYESEMNKQK